ncbi:hypothetical protein [Bradyrhizobium sp. Ec3.3]|uniref:hypothetical protein n=1 Tax=Bradyrhizobium sp. Ec3.3 TaxID=189753 RepID=UPI000481497F|nr:hypothetical protein [Bradyrhizobium sp. Ec3.3]
MTSLRDNAPRRYFIDEVGRRVLIGLTHEETFEFERLDGQSILHREGRPATHDERGRWVADGEQRWLELYAKHEGAWKAWMAQSRKEQGSNFSLY